MLRNDSELTRYSSRNLNILENAENVGNVTKMLERWRNIIGEVSHIFSEAKNLIQTKKALPLNGKNNIAFDSIEIFSREKRGVKVNLIKINKVFNK